ncbi:MAG TPA: hypothetical protein DCL29_06900 [Eubacterium sp.]|nr:hypothetical protein [Eubacterium sp.]
MNNKYGLEVSQESFNINLKRNINLIYKLLPMREEGSDWNKTLDTIMEELVGMNRLLVDLQPALFPIICKLEGLYSLTDKKDMSLFRRTIFECLALLSKLDYECIR